MVVQAGRHWEKAEEWEKAIACYQKGLEVDPVSEDMCRGLISCNVRMGRAARPRPGQEIKRPRRLNLRTDAGVKTLEPIGWSSVTIAL